MSRLQEKLDEIRSNKNRESFLSDIKGEFRHAIEEAEYCCEKSKLKFAAWSTWKEGKWTTTRGDVATWKREEFEIWEEVISKLVSLNKPKTEKGWLLFSPEGPYYKVDGAFIEKYINEISHYSKQHESFDIAWIGEERDFGIITEYNPAYDGKLEFELCTWGL